MKRSSFYLLLLCLLSVITYLDRVCISVAGPRMQDALHISPQQWGWVGTAFLLAYAGFEIPSGHWGDRLGPRKVLTRIVLWWSFFTAMTGAVASYPLLLITRFLFGAGEAGAYPNGSVVIANWFPPALRGLAFGFFMMSGQIGGALSPLLVVPMQQSRGWRSSFFVFASLGVVWSAVWFWKFRDQHPGSAKAKKHETTSWFSILRSANLGAIMALTFGYIYTYSFFQTWFHTYLVRGRGFSEHALQWSSLPYFCGGAANLLGGLVCDWLVARIGLKWSRRGVGMMGLFVSGSSIVSTFFVQSQFSLIACLSLAYAGISFQQPAVFSACLDIGGSRGGAISGFMNMAGQIGGALSSAVFGYLVQATGSYSVPLIPMAALLYCGSLLWTKVDVTKLLIGGGGDFDVRLGSS